MNKVPERRRILLVDRKAQLKYVGIVTATVLIVNLLIGFCIYFSVWSSLNAEYSKIVIAQKIQLVERIHAYQEARAGHASAAKRVEEEADLLSDHLLGQLRDSFRSAQMKLLPILALLLLVVIFEGIVISNRIAGPIYHVEQSLEKLSQGDLTEHTKFRKRDEFKMLSDKVNLVTEQWGYSLSSVKKHLSKISDAAADLKQTLGRYNPEMETQVSAKAEQILKRVTDCNNVLAKFTLPQESPTEAEKKQG